MCLIIIAVLLWGTLAFVLGWGKKNNGNNSSKK
jgi:hypothetical protein